MAVPRNPILSGMAKTGTISVMMTAGQSQACAPWPRLSREKGPLCSQGSYGDFYVYVHASMVDFLTALKHKHVLLCLIETLQQMFYDYSTNGKKKKDAEKSQHHGFYGRVLLSWQFTVQLGNEGISQDAGNPV